jgi:hypothetical protein
VAGAGATASVCQWTADSGRPTVAENFRGQRTEGAADDDGWGG